MMLPKVPLWVRMGVPEKFVRRLVTWGLIGVWVLVVKRPLMWRLGVLEMQMMKLLTWGLKHHYLDAPEGVGQLKWMWLLVVGIQMGMGSLLLFLVRTVVLIVGRVLRTILL